MELEPRRALTASKMMSDSGRESCFRSSTEAGVTIPLQFTVIDDTIGSPLIPDRLRVCSRISGLSYFTTLSRCAWWRSIVLLSEHTCTSIIKDFDPLQQRMSGILSPAPVGILGSLITSYSFFSSCPTIKSNTPLWRVIRHGWTRGHTCII